MSVAEKLDFSSSHFNPKAKRFLTPDLYLMERPEELEKRPFDTPYNYASNDPINSFDPTGNAPPLGDKEVVETSPHGKRDTGIPGASKNHKGADYRAAKDTSVYATKDGVVRGAGPAKGGSRVKIYHKDKSWTTSRHIKPTVKQGQKVKEGQQIGKTCVGSSCGTKQPHLHFERTKPGETKPSNPTPFVRTEKLILELKQVKPSQ